MMYNYELTIGNFVNYKGKIHTILGIKNEKVEISEVAYWINISEIKAIELTEEILLKCPDLKQCSFVNDFRLDLRYDGSQFHIRKLNDRFIFRGLGMSIVYVDTLHHLQNLVFINTLKKLQINL